MDDKKIQPGLYYAGLVTRNEERQYPAWRYHAMYEPKIVYSTEEDQQASDAGWKDPEVPITAVPHLHNWYHDLEDMTERQLSAFAREEYGVNFPPEAGKECLIKAIWQISRHAPQHRGRMVLLAQSVRMNYDETIKTIQKMAENGFSETETKEVWL